MSYSGYDIHNLSADVTHTTNDKGYHHYILGMTVGRVELIEQSDHWFIAYIDSDRVFSGEYPRFSSLRAALQAAEMVNDSVSPSDVAAEYNYS